MAPECPEEVAESEPATNPIPGKGEGAESREGASSLLEKEESARAEPANPPLDLPGPTSLCESLRDVIERKLNEGLCGKRIWQDLVDDHEFTGSYKGKIESGIKYVRQNALKGHVFNTLAEQDQHLENWERRVADHRIHGTTKQQVKHRFEQAERAALLPLPSDRFPFFHEAERKVHRDAHVEVDKAYYSVPPEYLGHHVWVRWDTRLVRLFNQRFESIAIHAKLTPGRFSTQPEHLASKKISAVERGAEFLLKRAYRIGSDTGQWAQVMLEERGVPGVRVLVGLLAMTHDYPARQIEQACARARAQGAFRLKALRTLIREPIEQQQFHFVQTHELIRPMDEYARRIPVSFQPPSPSGPNPTSSHPESQQGQQE